MVYCLTIITDADPIIVGTIASERVATKMSAGSDEESIASDTLLSALGQLPIAPSSSADNMKEGSTTALSAKHALKKNYSVLAKD